MPTKLTEAEAIAEWPGLNADQAREIKVGDDVWILPLWNDSHRKEYHIVNPMKVTQIIIDEQNSQTGVMLWVEDSKGRREFLDAGWFYKQQGEGDEASTT